VLCVACWSRLRPAPAIDPPAGLHACCALLSYEGTARDLIVGLKYRNARAVLDRIGGALALVVEAEPLHRQDAPIDVVTWAPTARHRRRERGYDQAQLLAHAVARRLGLACRPLLDRHDGPVQTGRNRADRLIGPVFVVRPVRTRVAPRVLLIDDVLTTGATLQAGAHALRELGVTRVDGATAAYTIGHTDDVIRATSNEIPAQPR